MTDIKKKIQDEIATLDYELKVELPKEILKARAHGDLSENAEYPDGPEASLDHLFSEHGPEPLGKDADRAVLAAGAAGRTLKHGFGKVLEQFTINFAGAEERGLETVGCADELAEHADLLWRRDRRVVGHALYRAMLKALPALGAGIELEDLLGRELFRE